MNDDIIIVEDDQPGAEAPTGAWKVLIVDDEHMNLRILAGMLEQDYEVLLAKNGEQALARVANEIEFFHPDVAVELEVVRRHAEMDSMSKALREFAGRMNAPDVNALASLVTQTERTGTNVAVAVTEFADSIRRQFRQRAEERANKTSIRMLFPVVLCLSPPVLILLLGPPALQLREFLQNSRKPGGVLDSSSFNDSVSTPASR